MRLGIHWILGHGGVPCNERVDAKAKWAIADGLSPCKDLPHKLPYSLTAVRGAFKKEFRECWRAIWRNSPCRIRLAKINMKLPSHSFLKVTDQLTRAQASVLMQLRTGHIPLNTFLHCISKIKSLDCPTCRNAIETIHHFLFNCPSHVHVWHGLARALGCKLKSLWHLLGNQQAFGSVLKYVQATGQFKSVYGDLPDKSLEA